MTKVDKQIQVLVQRFVECYKGLWLVGFSGGSDSVALVHVLQSLNVPMHLLHVNYQLRGEESEEDMRFCEAFATQFHLPITVVMANKYSPDWQQHGNLQEEARNLRYQAMDETAARVKAEWIAVAHHQSDQAETILHQFIRGGHLAALRGMPECRDKLIRPFLNVPKHLIETYLLEHKLTFRSDSSNANTKYTRNKIRHEVLEALQEVNADVVSSLAGRASYFAEVERMMLAETESIFSQLPNRMELEVAWLEAYPYKRVLLWQWLKPHGFGPSAVEEALGLLHSATGARISSASHTLWRERGTLLLKEKSADLHGDVLLYETDLDVHGAAPISVKRSSVQAMDFSDSTKIFVDMAKVVWPMCLRPWKVGDRIVPFGMTGSQLVSDVLTQAKVPSAKRAETLVLCDAEQKVLWVVGLKTSNLFRVGSTTQDVMEIKMK